jgi:hypothetical protein
MEVAKEEHFDRGIAAHDARYGFDGGLVAMTAEIRKRARKKRLSPVCLNRPRLAANK